MATADGIVASGDGVEYEILQESSLGNHLFFPCAVNCCFETNQDTNSRCFCLTMP